MATSVEAKLERARVIRSQAAKVSDPDAKSALKEAAARLERNAAKQASKIGRRVRRKKRPVASLGVTNITLGR